MATRPSRNLLKDSSFLVVTHSYNPNTGQPDLFVDYLRQNMCNVAVMRHPFHYSPNVQSSFEVYRDGILVSRRRLRSLPKTELLLYTRDLISTLSVVFSMKVIYDVYIGVDPLNAFAGLILRRLRRVKKVILYTIDLPARRFDSSLWNSLYHRLDSISAKGCDSIWDLSPRMSLLRRSFGENQLGRKTRVVPSVFPLRAGMFVEKSEIFRMLFVGHLKESQGLQLAIESMPEILRRFPQARLLVIGTGPFESNLRTLVHALRLDVSVTFLGQIEDHRMIEVILGRGGVGIAPYVPQLEGITTNADPMKPKVYLACGLPIVMTRVPWFARVIEERNAGVIIDYDKKQFIDAISTVLGDETRYLDFRNNALRVAEDYTPDEVFGSAVESLFSSAS